MARLRRSLLLVCTAALLAATGCHARDDKLIGPRINAPVPLGLPPLPHPKINPVTADAVALGRKLFYDRRLSGDETVSCATCHDPAKAFADGRTVSVGMGGKLGDRNAPTVLNAAYLETQFWDGRTLTLEQQSAVPMADTREMNQNHFMTVFRINADPEYRAMASKTFGSPVLDAERVQKALATFERTLLSGDSAFDRYQYGGDKSALTPAQVRGLAVFQDPHRGNCAICHTIRKNDALFTDGKFHNIGIGVRDDGTIADVGRFAVTHKAKDTGAFRTPTLRNVALTAPYMHDGSEKTLDEVVNYYMGHGNSNQYLDPEMQKIKLTLQDRADLVEFLKALTGSMPKQAGPPGTD